MVDVVGRKRVWREEGEEDGRRGGFLAVFVICYIDVVSVVGGDDSNGGSDGGDLD